MYASVVFIMLTNVVARVQSLDPLEDVDFVIIGAGSAGSVVANRLSEEETWTVLLLEAGVEESFLTDIPIMAAVQSSTAYNWGYKSDPSDFSCLGMIDERCALPRGKALGGTSVINFLLYTRGNKLDFDEWASSGNQGWSYEDVLPYFIKSENCSACSDVDRQFHGYQGNLHVQHPPFETPLVKHFLQAGEELGHSVTDPNGRSHVGFSRALATMENGRRCSAAKAFLKPIRNRRPNLHIITKARVTKILIHPETKRAYAVEFLKSKKKHVIRIKKEVVLSAGAFNSPHLLMLSGVGPKDELERAGIPVIKELNVGFNLQDHVNFNPLVFLVNQSVTISDFKLQNPLDVFDYVLNGEGPFTIPGGAEALAFVTTKNSSSGDYPDVEIVLAAGGLHGDSYGSMRRCLGIPAKFYDTVYGSIRDRPGFSMSVVLMRPKSRGRVTLKDSNPLHWPTIKMNYFQEEDDLDVMVEGIKKTLQIANTESFRKLGTRLHDVPFPGCESLPFAGDAYWKCALRTMATTLGHQVGTCKMGPREDLEAVVDDQLRVHGVGNLRVVGASIMPNVIAGHTNSVAVMIGEKGSDLIKKTWQ